LIATKSEHLNVQRHSAALHAKITIILSDPKMRPADKAFESPASRKLRSLGEYTWLVELKRPALLILTA
jgi:hypothetical protein